VDINLTSYTYLLIQFQPCFFSRYESDVDAYREAVRANVQTWNERIYDPPATSDPHYPAFSPYQPQIHEPVRATMLAEAKKQETSAKSGTSRKGYSFIEQGSLQIFSKESS